MKSITHAAGEITSTSKRNRAAPPSSAQASDHIRGFHYDPRRAALGYDYLRRKWLPREGPLFYAFIQVLRGHCYYNPQTGEIRESCYPTVETIARECDVDPATIHRFLRRDKATGEFISKHAEALSCFIKIQPRWRYDARVGHKVQQSSLYLVALDDPPVPEDDHLVAEKEAELAAILTLEQVRRQHQAEAAMTHEETSGERTPGQRGPDLHDQAQRAMPSTAPEENRDASTLHEEGDSTDLQDAAAGTLLTRKMQVSNVSQNARQIVTFNYYF